MNKFFKNLIILLVIVCTISTFSLASSKNMTNPNGKGTVTYKEDVDVNGKPGTEDNPYQLIMGEGIIDIYYGDNVADHRGIYFEFVSGDYNAGNYLVDHNADKKRIRFSLIGTDDISLRVTSENGLNYMQAGGVTYYPSGEKIEVQKPFYDITAIEYAEGALNTKINLANGYIPDSLLSNLSNYSTSYVFSKSNIKLSNAYPNIQIVSTNKTSSNLVVISDAETVDVDNKTIKVVYCFNGTSSDTVNNEEAGPIEWMISKILIAIGDLFIKISGLGGWNGDTYISIDTLVFNEYPNTIVNFFGDTGYTNADAKVVINFWFKAFKAWAIIIYIILLIYIGIKTVLVSGTSEQKKVKGMLEGWLQGLLLLFFLPFLFKYLIVINDALVDIVRVNSKYSVHAYYSFADMYEAFGGQEDGEDSTTKMLEKFKNAREELQEKIEALEVKKAEKEAELEEWTEENNYEKMWNDLGITGQIDIYKGIINSKSFIKDGIEITIEDIENDLINIGKEFYQDEEKREEVITSKNKPLAWILEDDEDFKKIIEEYCKNLQIESAAGGIEDLDSTIVREMFYLAHGITCRECFYLVGENLEYQKDLDYTQPINNMKKELANIDLAIEKLEEEDVDITRAMRENAGDTGRFVYVAIWYALIFEVIFLLFLYYKRLFMLMVLIAIFPLITIAYAYEKAKGGKAAILKNWIQEYLINIFIQSVHAILYVTLVEAGYTVYLGNKDGWLIFFIAVLALIIVEPIFKNMLGLKGSTVTDLAKYGSKSMKAVGSAIAVGSTLAHTRKDFKNIDNASKNKEVKINKKQERNDGRVDTLRQHRDNRINKNSNLTKEEKEAKLKDVHDRDKEKDSKREKRRKMAAKARMNRRRIQKVARVTANVASAFGTVAGGLAAGGDIEDFATAAGIAKTITGTGAKGEKLSDDAKKLDEKNKTNVTSNVGSVTSESAKDPINTNYSGGSYDNYGYQTSASDPTIDSSITHNPIKMVKNWHNSNIANAYAKRLDEEKLYVNKKYNVKEEDEN